MFFNCNLVDSFGSGFAYISKQVKIQITDAVCKQQSNALIYCLVLFLRLYFPS